MGPHWNRPHQRRKAERTTIRQKTSPASDAAFWERYITSLIRRPAEAITWKNLIASKRIQTLRPAFFMAVGVPIILGATLVPALNHLTSFAMGLSSAWAGLLLFAGPQFVRNDLRLDLPRLRLLRTYPLTSLEICVAEVGASVSVLLLLQFVMLILSTAALVFNPALPLGPGRILAIAIALACLLPGMTAMNVFGTESLRGRFPQVDDTRHQGAEQIDESGTGLFLAAGLGDCLRGVDDTAGDCGSRRRPTRSGRFGDIAAIISCALVAGAIALGEAALVLRWMATLFDRVDLASVTGESNG